MKYRKIALINPPLDDCAVKCVDDGFWEPLNLLTLASYLRANDYRGEIKILDQSVMSRQEICDELGLFQPDLVGMSPNLDSYNQTLDIAEKAKQNGADVVLGGAYATTLADKILSNRDFIDFVILYEGEKALLALASGCSPETISNLAWRNNGQIVFNIIALMDTATLCEIDYSFIDLPRYFNNYSKSLNPGRYKKPIAILTQRGCVWRDKTQGCLFCSRINKKAVFDNNDDIWRRLGKLQDRYGIDALLDVGDDFLGNIDWFRKFYKSRPDCMRDIGIRFIYSRVEHITDSIADMLMDLNVSEICLGLESGDREILKKVRKGNSPEQHLNAVKLLAERDIKIIAAFMLGHPGENKASMDETAEHILKIIGFKNTNELVVSLFTPLPGSRAYNMLLEKSNVISGAVRNSDIFHAQEFQKEWVRYFCETSFDTILEYAGTLEKLYKCAYVEFADKKCGNGD
ncbi:MAG: B12-binding domain-containing radical SAM protein [Paludibacteraceae bacterium]